MYFEIENISDTSKVILHFSDKRSNSYGPEYERQFFSGTISIYLGDLSCRVPQLNIVLVNKHIFFFSGMYDHILQYFMYLNLNL